MTTLEPNQYLFSMGFGSSVLLALLLHVDASQVNPHLATAAEQLERLEAVDALKTLQLAKSWAYNTSLDLARVQLLIGLAHASLAHETEAIESFRNARILNPLTELSPKVGPRVLEWWRRAAPPNANQAPIAAITPAPSEAPPAEAVSRKMAWTTKLAIPLLVGAAVAAGVGIWSGQMASDNAARAKAEQAIDAAQALHRQSVGNALIANGLYVTAAPLAVGGALLLFW